MPDYSLCGWRLRSDKPLPLLAATHTEQQDADINVIHATIPPVDQAIVLSGPFMTVYANGQALVHIDNTLSILVSEGRYIIVDAATGTSAEEVMTFLLGPALGLICHQRRVLPLHGATIKIGDKCVTLVGHSGAGKSTSATALIKRGHQLLCDDITVVNAVQGTVQPSYPAVKLWQDAADALKIETSQLSKARSALQKFHYPAPTVFDSSPAPLSAIIILQARTSIAEAKLTPFNKLGALALLLPFIYRRKLAQVLGAEQACMTQLGALVSKVPAFSLARPGDFIDFDNTMALIENAVSA